MKPKVVVMPEVCKNCVFYVSMRKHGKYLGGYCRKHNEPTTAYNSCRHFKDRRKPLGEEQKKRTLLRFGNLRVTWG